MTQQTVSDWERGVGLPHRTRTGDLARVLGLGSTTVLLAIHGESTGGPSSMSADDLFRELEVRDPEAYAQVRSLIKVLLARAREGD